MGSNKNPPCSGYPCVSYFVGSLKKGNMGISCEGMFCKECTWYHGNIDRIDKHQIPKIITLSRILGRPLKVVELPLIHKP